MIRYGWHIFLTNLDENHSCKDLFEIYRLRWNIEVRFKAWKQAINMKSLFSRASNFHHQEALIYAALIFQLITLNVAANIDLRGRSLSLENFSKDIAKSISVVTRRVSLIFKFDPRHDLMERRKRVPLMDQVLIDQLYAHGLVPSRPVNRYPLLWLDLRILFKLRMLYLPCKIYSHHPEKMINLTLFSSAFISISSKITIARSG